MKVFLYDGNCPFCLGVASKLQSLCLDPNIEFKSFRDMKSNELLNLHKDLSNEVLCANINYIYKEIRYPGFFGIRKLSHSLRGYRYISFTLYLPLIPFIGMLVMKILKSKTNH